MTDGVRQIVRFNWPFYAVGLGASAVAVWLGLNSSVPVAARACAWLIAGLTLFWIVASLLASWMVYDRSRLGRWTWVRDALGVQPRTWINIHAGLDESSNALRALLGSQSSRVFDIHDPVEMTEGSIDRARRLARNQIDPELVDFRRLPVSSGTVDAAFLLLAAHELRSDVARGVLFREISRVLTSTGRAIVAEHLRNCSNFLAFGPGFLHFHSRRTWLRCFKHAGLVTEAEFPITPFVRVFVLRPKA